jgi:hypothetical protein
MVEAPGGARLAQEALAHVAHRVVGRVREQRLDRDVALDQRILRKMDCGHRAAPKLADDEITSEPLLLHPIPRSPRASFAEFGAGIKVAQRSRLDSAVRTANFGRFGVLGTLGACKRLVTSR